MPKENIDYSNTIIYKIYCNDKTINDVYVGHTTNFTKRKHQHKLCCSNLNNKFKIYNTIREHGGWDNWNMLEIAKYNCKDKTEARIKEQQHYAELNSSLNSCPPYVDKNKYFCSTCNINCNTKNVYETHINCSLHNKILHKNVQSIQHTFRCDFCDFKCSKSSDLTRHNSTLKHKMVTNGNIALNFTPEHICGCGATYKHCSGLSRHKKTCSFVNSNENFIENNNGDDNKDLITFLIKENSEIKNLILEMSKNLILEMSKNKYYNKYK
jgi:hypothetical protein